MAVLHKDLDAWLELESDIDTVRCLLTRASTEESAFEVRAQ